jgi:DNA-binding transcriptional MerR regulator
MRSITKADLRYRAGLLNILEVAKLVGIPERRFRYLIECECVFQPQTRIGKRRRAYYTTEEIEQIQGLLIAKT